MSIARLPRVGEFLFAIGLAAVSFLSAHPNSEAESVATGPLFAVIPTLGIGAPLAILALLFPSLFGGVLVLFRQWGAFFLVVSINSLLYCVQWWWAAELRDSWWGQQSSLWLVMTLITLAGIGWSWRKETKALKSGQLVADVPARTENLVLWLLSFSCVASFAYFVWAGLIFDTMWALVLVLAIGIWTGTVYKLLQSVLSRGGATGVPTEGVMLGAMLAGCIVFVAGRATPRGDTSDFVPAEGQMVAQRDETKKAAVKLERFDAFYGVPVHIGLVLSSPLVAGDHVFLAMSEEDPGQDPTKGMGALLCINRHTNQIVWAFNNDSKMQPVFSSPCLSNGRIYIGEGFHYNPNCKLYCVNAATGKKLGEFPTKSQVESSPAVANDKVYFGAGNEGVYALAAVPDKDGVLKEAWHFKPKSDKVVRFGASPAVTGGKVYIGSGVDRIYEEQNPGSCETALFCLDAASGKELWKVPVNLPCWAAPVVSGDVVFFGLGNGDLYFDAATPAGAVMCLDVKTGKEIWTYQVPGEKESHSNGVHTCPAIDAQSVYVGSRTGYCYCLDRFTGKLRWKKHVGSPVFASPVLDQGSQTGCAVNVFVLATGGRVSCLDAKTGQAHWTYHDLEQQDVFLASTPAIVSVPTPAGIRRQIYFGMFYGFPNGLKKEPFLYALEDVLTVPAMKAVEPPQP